MKWFLDKLYEDIKLHPNIKKYSDECESSLIYGFGHYPAPVRVDLKNFGKDPAKASNAVWALVSMSLRYPVFSENGKSFEIFDTGSQNDENCAFRAVAVGAGLEPNGYNEIQKEVIEGARKLLNELRNGSGRKTLDTNFLLESEDINLPEKNEEYLAEWLRKYISDRENGFVGGMTDVDRSLATISLGRQICVIDVEEGREYTFLPNGEKVDGIKPGKKDNQIYISIVSGHLTALLPLDKLDNDHKMPDNSELESEVKDAVKKSITDIIVKEIKKGKRSKLLKSMSEYSNFYVDYINVNKRTKNNEDLYTIMDMIGEIVEKMSSKETKKIEKIEQELSNLAEGIIENGKDVKTIESKLEEHIEITSKKAVEICKKEPLFWYNNRPQHEDEN